MLEQVTSGGGGEGIRAVIASVEGMGKTTLLASTPRPLLIPMEDGTKAAGNVARTPLITSWEALISLMDEIRTSAQKGQLAYQSLAFDSGTALERLIHDNVIRSDPKYKPGNATKITMESGHDGYGKGYNLANADFMTFLGRCDELARHAHINIFISCHVFASKVIDPAVGEYNQWDMLLHSPKNEKNYGKRELITQWADFVGFLHEPTFVTKGKEDTAARGTSKLEGRVVAVDRTPAWVAKNRFRLSGTIPIPVEQGWNAIAHAIHQSTGEDFFSRP